MPTIHDDMGKEQLDIKNGAMVVSPSTMLEVKELPNLLHTSVSIDFDCSRALKKAKMDMKVLTSILFNFSNFK